MDAVDERVRRDDRAVRARRLPGRSVVADAEEDAAGLRMARARFLADCADRRNERVLS
jgi:hypothetical protein